MSGQPKLQFRDALRKMVPPWLADRGASLANTGFKLLWVFAVVLDAILEWLVQGAQARMPGLGTPTALRMTGRDRGIIPGVVETDEHYAARQQRWLEAHKRRGHPWELCRQIRDYLGADIMVRTVDSSGNWHTVAPGGAETSAHVPGSWDWDGNLVAWSRMWVIIYAPAAWVQWKAFYELDPELWGGWLEGENYTIGHTTPYDVAEDLREICRYWKPQHVRVWNVIVAFDPASFDPENAATWPDGSWGTYTAGEPQAATRPESARYWEGVL